MKQLSLTVFTEPRWVKGLLPRMKSIARPVKHFLQGKKIELIRKYGGHYAVTRSLVQGLKKIKADFNYNPSSEKNISGNVVVLAGVERLKELIELKKNGKVRRLIAGPNVLEDVRSENELVADPAIDYYLVPSPWVRDLAIADCEKLKGRVRCWYAGIDTEYWKPSGNREQRNQVLIYWKTEPAAFYEKVVAIVKQRGLSYTMLKYAAHNRREYKQQLEKSRLAIFISRSESQGIALAEAWSMDVPTLVFDPGEFFFTGRMIYNVSAAPYLEPGAGLTWKTIDKLGSLLDDNNFLTGFSPRELALKKFTDEYCARQLLDILHN